ncbi:uncharacterized protein LOC106669330 isoform X2 [Cimex lectularius]|nr:uncharacterized protein LOC106669330 isoform X2 [Cimex lectularius]XP_014254224.1 uncharacterized protein LOC106669330 isoform X2 [Cimex lectularius]
MITAMLHIPLTDNFLIERKYIPLQYVLTYSYLGPNLIANIVVLIAVGTKNTNHLKWGLNVAFVCFFYWLFLSTISYISVHDLFRFVCFENHCPEIHWMFNTKWRDYGIKCPYHMTYPNGTGDLDNKDGLVLRISYGSPKGSQNDLKAYYTGCESYTSGPMAISTVLGLVWLLFAIHSFKTIRKLHVILSQEEQSK